MIDRIKMERYFLFEPAARVVLRAKISGEPSVENLRNAIKKATKKYAILNCKILQDRDGECFYIPKEKWEVPEICVVNEFVGMDAFIKQQEKKYMDLQKGELMWFQIQRTNKGVYLYMVLHHLAGDGKSILILLKEIMQNLQKMNQNSSNEDDSSEVVPIQILTSEYLKQYTQEDNSLEEIAQQLNEQWKKEKQLYTFEDYEKLYMRYQRENEFQLKTITIEKKQFDKFCAVCKEHDVTVNSALITIIVKKLRVLKNFSMAVDLRTKDFTGMGNYVAALLLDFLYNQNESFWFNAREISDLVKYKLDNRMELASGLLLKGMFESSLQDAIYFESESECVKEFGKLACFNEVPVSISNLGKVDWSQEESAYGIEELSFLSPLVSGLDCNIGVISTNNCMVINMMYHQNKIDYASLLDDVARQMNELIQ